MLEILVGFTGGQIQLMDPMRHECLKCFNEEVCLFKCCHLVRDVANVVKQVPSGFLHHLLHISNSTFVNLSLA